MDANLTGALIGAGLGLAAGALNWAFFSRIEENAVKGLDRDAAGSKRDMYGKLRVGVLVADVVIFAVVGWFVAGAFLK
jgi:hypothetical protein